MINILEVSNRLRQSIGLTGYTITEFCSITSAPDVLTKLLVQGKAALKYYNNLDQIISFLEDANVAVTAHWIQYGSGSSPRLIQTDLTPCPDNKIGFRLRQAIGLTGKNVNSFAIENRRGRTKIVLLLNGKKKLEKESDISDLISDLESSGVNCDKNWLITGSPSVSGSSISLIENNVNFIADEEVQFISLDPNQSIHEIRSSNLEPYISFGSRVGAIKINITDQEIYPILSVIKVGKKQEEHIGYLYKTKNTYSLLAVNNKIILPNIDKKYLNNIKKVTRIWIK
jgi:hypothetical protein